MLRRVPKTADGKQVDRLQESTRVNKAFKVPTPIVPVGRDQPKRKRKRVSYSGQDAEAGDSDDSGSKKKKKNGDSLKDKDGIWHNEEELLASHPKFPVYKAKPDQITRRFSMPTMKNKDGSLVTLVASGVSLGIRPPTKVIPRPLHDPMEDHAIVLYDPTIDDRETDEERQERLKEEAKEKAEKEAQEKNVGLFNPHKSLKQMLGEGKDKTKLEKVPVVIDPRLSKVLRPHQVEGVKASPPYVCFVKTF